MSSPESTNEARELRRLIPLSTLSASHFEQLCSELRIEDGAKGTILFHQGDPTTEFVYVLSGSISLQAGGVEMDSVTGGSDTSRFALAHQNPRKVSAVAKERIRYVRIKTDLINQRDDAQTPPPAYTVSHSPDVSGGDWISALLRSPVFRRLPPSNLQALLRNVEEIHCQAGDIICRQDDPGDFYYIIKQGQCTLTRKPSPLAKEIKLATLKDCDTFGEDALISDKPRTVTITMATDGILLRLDKANFLKLVGNPAIAHVDAREAMEMVKHNAGWLDLRLPDLYQQGHPRGALNTPFFSLRMMLATLDRHKKYILVCEDGKVSEAGTYLLLRHGYDAYALRGGIDTVPPEEISVDREPPESPGLPETGPEDTDTIDIELTAWEPPIVELDSPAEAMSMRFDAAESEPTADADSTARHPPVPDQSAELRRVRERLARAEREVQHLETERGRLAREKEQAGIELEKARHAIQQLETNPRSPRLEHERLARERIESAPVADSVDLAAMAALRRELEEIKAAHAESLFGKQTAEQEIENLQKQVGDLKSVVEDFLDGGEYPPDEEVDALRTELDMVRQHAGAELAALQARVSEVEGENAKLRGETQTLKTQLSVREVAATVAIREAEIPDQGSLSKHLLWPVAIGMLVALLTLGGLFGLEAGRDLLRSWLDGGVQTSPSPADAAPPPANGNPS